MFSDRLIVKKEVTEIKKEEDLAVLTEVQAKVEILTPTSVKRERQEDGGENAAKSLIVEERVASKRTVKRRRKT